MKVLIEGKRKVWGTLRATSAGAVKNTIKALSKIEVTFDIKRKYHLRSSGGSNDQVSKWWFIISGQEADLKLLSECWNVVKLQTNWSLESVYSYAEPVPANQPLSINTANNQHNQVTASPQQTLENTTQQSNTSTTPPLDLSPPLSPSTPGDQ